MTQKVEDLIKQFRPQFGNTEHIEIAKRIGSFRKLADMVRKHNHRVNALNKAVRQQTQNEKRLEAEEKSLIARLEKEINGTTQ